MGDTCSRARLEKGHPELLASRPPVFLQVKDGNPNIRPWESQQNAFTGLRHRLSAWMLVLSSGKVPLAPACGGVCGIELELELGEGGLPPVTPLFPSAALLCSACRHSTSRVRLALSLLYFLLVVYLVLLLNASFQRFPAGPQKHGGSCPVTLYPPILLKITPSSVLGRGFPGVSYTGSHVVCQPRQLYFFLPNQDVLGLLPY